MFRILILFPVLLFTFVFLSHRNVSAMDTIRLSKQIAESLNQVPSQIYKTVAFAQIIGELDNASANDLIDFSNVAIVKNRKYRVIDRSKLQLILKEQQFNTTGFVSSDEYKELGRLLGVDLFIYGKAYSDILILKGIDVQSSAIVWSDIFEIHQPSYSTVELQHFAEKVVQSIEKDVSRLRENKIKNISFWGIRSEYENSKVINLLSVALTRQGIFSVIDRDNLALILEEQKLSMTDFIDEQRAKKMGELYGIDAFVYGNISVKGGQKIASLKMLNIFNGVIEWADLIPLNSNQVDYGKRKEKRNSSGEKEMVLVKKGTFIMGSNVGDEISKPQFKVPLRAFWIDSTEVSNQEYKEFVDRFRHRLPPSWKGGKIPSGKGNYPVVMVTWDDASRYCRTQNKRLPKEVEWEKAYRGEKGRLFPWAGDKHQPDFSVTREAGKSGPLSVTAVNQDISVYGVKHLAGNVREWVDSYLRPYPGSKFSSPEYGRERVIRGGSWANRVAQSMGWSRGSSKSVNAWPDVGFRCARSYQ